MAFFAVTTETIQTLSPIKDADNIEVATLEGVDFQFVVRKNEYKAGDTVVYFPLDSLLPAWLVQKTGLKLAGPDQNRVKTVRLRGALSQGIVLPVEMLNEYGIKPGDNITEKLGVTKWEPEPEIMKSGLLPLPTGISKYDIEGCERYGDVVKYLMDCYVVVTEKLEGQNFSVHIDDAGKIWVNQRGFSIEENPDNHFWKAAHDGGFIELAKKLWEETGNGSVTIYAELCGPKIQNNIYKLTKHEAFAFDLKLRDKWVNANEKFVILSRTTKTVPILSFGVTLRKFLDGMSVKEASTGFSKMTPHQYREGIVISPYVEEFNQDLGGRLILKQRCPIYLSKEK